jgi:hypothetical protein
VIEQTFADLIDGPLAHLPSGRFAANAAWLTCAGMLQGRRPRPPAAVARLVQLVPPTRVDSVDEGDGPHRHPEGRPHSSRDAFETMAILGLCHLCYRPPREGGLVVSPM